MYFVARRCTHSTCFSRPTDCGDHTCATYPRWQRTKAKYNVRRVWMLCVLLNARRTKSRSLLALAHCSDICLSHVRSLETQTPRSFSVSQVSNLVPLFEYSYSTGHLFRVIGGHLHFDWLNLPHLPQAVSFLSLDRLSLWSLPQLCRQSSSFALVSQGMTFYLLLVPIRSKISQSLYVLK